MKTVSEMAHNSDKSFKEAKQYKELMQDTLDTLSKLTKCFEEDDYIVHTAEIDKNTLKNVAAILTRSTEMKSRFWKIEQNIEQFFELATLDGIRDYDLIESYNHIDGMIKQFTKDSCLIEQDALDLLIEIDPSETQNILGGLV